MVTCLNIDNDQTVGRLGNKLFILATMIALAKDNQDEVILPHWKYESLFQENCKIGENLGIQVQYSYREPTFNYTPIPYNRNMHLMGYYQSEKYFVKYKQDILNRYLFPNEKLLDSIFTDFHSRIYPQMDGCDGVVSIHVRRGDYVSLPNFHPLCGEAYYKNAIQYLENHANKNFYYLVFSDDIAWCKTFFKGERFIFEDGHSPEFDLFTMSNVCDHHIIANSSFSWWGAYLNKNPDKLILYPDRWFGPEANTWATNMSDLIPEGWIKCPVSA